MTVADDKPAAIPATNASAADIKIVATLRRRTVIRRPLVMRRANFIAAPVKCNLATSRPMIDTATISLGTASSNANDRNAEKSTGRGRIERVIGSVLQGKAQLQKNGTFFPKIGSQNNPEGLLGKVSE